ncbi:MAG: hypothetical protein WBA92_05060 [Pseudorhodobacter sp.]
MGNLDRKTIAAIFNAGIGRRGDIPAPAGNVSVWSDPADLEDFVNNPRAWSARKNAVAKGDYTAWANCGGRPQAGAATAKATRCKNPVSGGSQRLLLDWLSEDSGFCTVHAGENRDEARLNTWGRKS